MARAFRGAIVHCLDDPGTGAGAGAVEVFDDGVLLVEGGRVVRCAPASALLEGLGADVPVVDHRGRLIVPGFVDTHIHFPQTDAIASYGEQLLDWLERYVYPVEREFESAEHAAEAAEFFLSELLRNGTTTAMVMATVHRQCADALFAAAARRGMRVIAGKNMMDRNCPAYLRDTAESSYADSRELIEAWHGRGRLAYAVTPRFAPSSSPRQLERAGELLREFEDVYLQTHVAENAEEVAWVARLFPGSRSYLDVYDRFGLLRERSVLAHCIHLDDADRARLAASGAAAAFCPTSNLFLGSGLFDLERADAHGMRVGMGTDVGAGTSFGMLQTLAEAYKVAQLQGQRLSPYRALYLATLGGARCLRLDGAIGNFLPGKEADFVVLDPAATPLQERRVRRAREWPQRLFSLMMLGDDRSVVATHVLGEPRHRRE